MQRSSIRRETTREGPGVLGLLSALLLCALPCAMPSSARAEERAPRLVVLHRDDQDLPAAQREAVDRLVLSSVASQLRFASAYASEVPLEDVELAAGCSTRDADCMQRITATLGADWLLVRELSRDQQGHVFLTLIAHDGPGALVTRRVVSQIGGFSQGPGPRSKAAKVGETNAPAQVVPMLVERLYPKATSAWPVEHDERPSKQGWSAATVAGWSATGAGVSLLIAGSTVGALGRSDHREYERADLRHPGDVDQADNLLSRAQQRTRVANGLLIGGAAAGLAGAATLLWTYLHPHADVRGYRVGVTPARSSVSLSLAGKWRGGI
ncbi:MAG: hypothetical protein JWN48_2862 [Myxococcaceae bacterium]|nr:hypothetical protein [Myxococcaceae bacterium]